MESYGVILNYVVPVFFLLFFIEAGVAWYRGHHVIRGLDSVSSFSSGITNVVKDVLGLSINIIGYGWLVKHIAVISIPSSWMVYVIGFLAVDFQGYWVHRWSHEINFLWNRHIIHHSSEEFNLSCALRQSISGFVNYFTFLLIPAALVGVPVEVIGTILPIHLFLQYWYHTREIEKMGFLEHILVTPSHHRVHHAINPEYMDKNYSQIFIFWDKWFGTFQPELPEVPPVYGVRRQVNTWNPIIINFQHFWLMVKDAWRAAKWRDKLRIWFMPTGWRPEDVAIKHPVPYVTDVYRLTKFDTPATDALIGWSWVQLFFTYFLLIYFLGNIGTIGMPGVFLYGLMLFAGVYAYTELMNLNPYAWIFELIRSVLVLGWIVWNDWEWFGSGGAVGMWYVQVVVAHAILSPVMTVWILAVQRGKIRVVSS